MGRIQPRADTWNRNIGTIENDASEGAVCFLVMTGEDERSGGTLHARDNVIHEIGLFQGKLGFERAIVLLEEGCAKFSNIDGLTYISFPKGRVDACFEAIRKVLRREKLIL